MDYDEILTELGEFGRWQQITTILLWILIVAEGAHVLMFAFSGLVPKNGFRCMIPECDGDNFEFGDHPQLTFGTDADGAIDYCRYGKANVTEEKCTFSTTEFISCGADDSFAYNSFEYESSVITDFNLICEKQGLVAWVGSSYMIGLMMGSFVVGWMADRFGRKPALLFSILCSTLACLAGTFMPEYFSYTITRFFTGFGAKGAGLVVFSTLIEIVGTKESVPLVPWKVDYKTASGLMMQTPFGIGMALISLYSSFMPDWKTLHWSFSIFLILQFPCWYFSPESPRWLIASNRLDKAKQLLDKAAARNGRALTFPTLEAPSDEKANAKDTKNGGERQYGYKDMFSPTLRWVTVSFSICWLMINLVYYGITFSVSNLSEDVFLNNMIGGLVEIPAYIFVSLFVDLFGRKPIFVISLIFSGTSCILIGVLESEGARITMAFLGKLFGSATFSLVFLYSAELYPTTIRASAVGVFSFISRIGAIAAPQIALSLPNVTSDAAPFFVMGSGGFIAGLVALILPETLGSSLPETLEDVEAIKKRSRERKCCAKQ